MTFESLDQIFFPILAIHLIPTKAHHSDLTVNVFLSIVGINHLFSQFGQLFRKMLPKLLKRLFYPLLELIRGELNETEVLLKTSFTEHPN